MKLERPACVRTVEESLFGGKGDTAPALRRAIAATASSFGGAPAPTEPIPEALRGYVEKVARHAYKITDEDVAALRAAGHSEDAILEITFSAALGAGLVRMDRGLAALAAAKKDG